MAIATKDPILLVYPDAQVSFLLDRVLKSGGYTVIQCDDVIAAKNAIAANLPGLIILSEKINDAAGLDFAHEVSGRYPSTPIVLIMHQETPELTKNMMRSGVSDYLCLPVRAEELLTAVQTGLEKAQQRKEWVLLESRRATASLQRRVNELETLARLGRSVTGSLDLDSVLSAVVDAAVELTGAEEGTLLLLDESSGELYVRASRNFQEEFVRTFRLPVHDTLAGNVLRSGQPAVLDEKTPQKIKTSYLVHGLIYVPLQVHGHVFGVLGVDNRTNYIPFKDHDVKLLLALAEFAVIAIENARLYSTITLERNKLETILTHIQDGVVVVDNDRRILFISEVAKSAFALPESALTGREFDDIFPQSEMQELMTLQGAGLSNRIEVTVQDGRIFNAQVSTIPEVGSAITLHDITYLKKLDRIKSDFVSTVSHDLRSPLTAIMGYVELIERVGPVNDSQKEFIQRVQASVRNITTLVNDLLNLGRIEAGFDTRKEAVYLDQLIRFSTDNFRKEISDKHLHLELQLPGEFPPLFANPVQLRQMVDNLLNNAIKYTRENGEITIKGIVEGSQLILQFSDTGIGIPSSDLPFIFDKFYRASNVGMEMSGTGLGLSIVKTIVENHQGRIWVDSTPEHGTTFTIVFPLG